MLNSFFSRSPYLTQNTMFIDYKRGFYDSASENSLSTYVVTMANME